MALYNYGLCAQAKGEKKDALSFLQKALDNYSSEDGSRELENDLKLQIGILSCEMKQYESALEYLVPWYRQNRKIQRAGRVHYYLGTTYYGLKDSSKAMESLQRALRFNEFDDRAMHLLGRLYFSEKEGDTIALSLCQKSVELEPDVINYRFHLAQIQLRCGLVTEARENLRRCLRNSDLKADAQLFMARSYVQTDQMANAKGWYRKLVGRKDVKKEYIKEAMKVLH
jgi:tetratricopeptide (TPR) repeat protein